MFFGVTTLLLIVIVFVLVASDGGVVGLLAPLDELGPELLLHALIVSAMMAAAPIAARNLPALLRIRTLDRETVLTSHPRP
jgi:hypothetical protein